MPDEFQNKPRTMIGAKTAAILFLALAAAALATLKGKPLILALIIVGGVAVKSYLYYWKDRIGKDRSVP